jgi:hypothetical protein
MWLTFSEQELWLNRENPGILARAVMCQAFGLQEHDVAHSAVILNGTTSDRNVTLLQSPVSDPDVESVQLTS